MRQVSTQIRPPGPRFLPTLTVTRGYARDPLGYMQALATNYGPMTYARVAGTHSFFLHDPDAIDANYICLVFDRSRDQQRAPMRLPSAWPIVADGE